MMRLIRIALLLSTLAPWPAIAQGAAESELFIAATTDVHGRLRGWDYFDGRPDGERGLARAATVVDSLRRSHPGRVVLVDAGDLLQGNAMTYVAARIDSLAPHPVVAAMNVMGYDAAAVGNHEFNYGLPIFDRARRGAHFPFLAANTRRLDKGPGFPAHTVIVRRGVRIGIIGVTTPGSMVWDKDNLRGRLEVTDIVSALPARVRAVREAGADLVVVVAHAGFDGVASYDTLATGLPSENPMARVAHEVPGIDLIVYGHSHRERADTSVNGVMMMQPRNFAASVAVATIGLRREGERWRVVRKSGVLVPTAGRVEHPAVVSAVARAHGAAVRYSETVVGETSSRWRTDSARTVDAPLVDLILEVQRRVAKADLSTGAAFSLDAVLAPGPITVAQLARLYPYENTLRALRLSGAQVKGYLEQSARYFVVEENAGGPPRVRPDPRIPGFNFDLLSGADYTIDLSRPMGDRITGLSIGGRPIAPTDSFTVAINNYRASGGGGYAMLRGAQVVYEGQEEIRQLLIEEVKRVGRIEPAMYAKSNWRIVPEALAAAAQRAIRGERDFDTAPTVAPARSGAPRTLRIIAINDFHGALVPRPDGTAGNRGGAAEMAAVIKQEAASCTGNCVPLLVHGGDLFQGTPSSNFAFGRPVVQILNRLGLVAGALGNHEFDWGQDTLRARMRELRSPVLGANVTYADGRDVPWIPDDTMVTRGGIRIGIIGVADPGTPRTTMPKHVRDLRFLPPAPIITKRAAALRARGAEVVIVVAHLGGFCDRETGCRGEIFELAKELPANSVDAIVSGHTHSPVTTIVNGIPIVQARSSARAVGLIDLPVGGGAPTAPRLRTVNSDSITPDPEILAMVNTATAAVAGRVEAIVVTAAERMPRSGDQYALGNLIAEAQRSAGRGDVGVMNNGGIRAELRAGPVKWGDLFEIQPFENRLVVVTTKGAALRNYFEGLVRGSSARHHLAGVTLEYDPGAAVGARLKRVTFDDGSSLDDARRYRVVMTDFLAAGGDGVSLGADAVIEELNRTDIDALVEYLRARPNGRLVVDEVMRRPHIKKIND